MISTSRLHWKRSVGLSVGCLFLGFIGAAPAVAQDADQLQQKLEQLKQEYEATTQALQLRMAALEPQIWPRSVRLRPSSGRVPTRLGRSFKVRYLQNRRMTCFRKPTKKSRS